MVTTLIVLAHPDGRSFNGAWAEETHKACVNAGDTVLWSDLVAMNFDPVENELHYPHIGCDSVFDALKAQEEAAKANQLPADVAVEIEKMRRADRIIFHFPIWWFAPPAVLKGWFDRVLVHGELHSVKQRFDAGQFRGKKVLFCVTTGSSEAESSFNGKEGDIQMLLWPAAYTLRYLGFSVLKPEIIHGVHGYHSGKDRIQLQARLRRILNGQRSLIENFDKRPLIQFNLDTDFDADGKLRPDRPSYSQFIRHKP